MCEADGSMGRYCWDLILVGLVGWHLLEATFSQVMVTRIYETKEHMKHMNLLRQTKLC